MKPEFRIVADGADITPLISDRLVELQLTDKPGLESDTFQITIDDRDGAVSLPRRGAALEVLLGYAGAPLTRMGRYVVDTLTFSGAPDSLVIKGKSGDMRGQGKASRSWSWENVSLAGIVADLAARNGWRAACDVATVVVRAEQIRESDFHFITRLARQYDCTAKMANNSLLVQPRQAGRSSSGQALEVPVLGRGDVGSFRFTLDDRRVVSAVVVPYRASDGVQRQVRVANADAPSQVKAEHCDRHLQPDEATARQVAASRLAEFNRNSAQVQLSMPGRADLFAELTIDLQGFKTGLDGRYLIDSVTHQYSASGWTTSVQCNGGAQGKGKAGEDG
ncbi:contractile injection system protein, VgrG/Pvc8 family [Pseudomonas sp. ZM23]|uniref:Contractile injection system protein, VgrG/Pvc8 family n=1 Tax=Pseudomonas triclosanedens TaxID=2961893 RepID=A0ABY7A0A5_9PSED|nr:contractile injection system protein, VgrG/Pvc8 family [Pseudomonas triclosanedens]MCP8463098.1 contractile injection system protein, VgrG/Pvc8 family [Pseudomonas triclosanedens]MCP8468718.1 contractile injection system protein, VgrG/Pvc8 family [Pseudomonas triclosanedens]MCP8475440.1 contractile injection system protein, VgrG/Pvc8 family [Pseudomonas triclosanedens]WAI50272.1 contractile injection system protein, VgrG/Pvc8 family [Pseudomonas triclosanedens]